MLIWLGGGLFIVGGAAFVFHHAGEHDRHASGWALLSIAVSSLFLGAAGWALKRHLAADDPDINLLYPALVVVAPVFGHALVAWLISKLPAAIPRVSGNSWRMRWLGSDETEANTRCRLAILGNTLRIEPESDSIAPCLTLQLSELVATISGEAVRIQRVSSSDFGAPLLFVPIDRPTRRENVIKHATLIAERISVSR